MATSCKIPPSFWTEDDIGRLLPEEKLALLWIVTNAEHNNVGYLRVSRRQFQFETGSALAALDGAMRKLAKRLLVEEDGDELAVLWLDYVQWNFGDSVAGGRSYMFRNLCRLTARLSPAMKSSLVNRYPALEQPLGDQDRPLLESWAKPIEAPSTPSNAIQQHSIPLSGVEADREEKSREEKSTEGGTGETGALDRPGLRYDLAEGLVRRLNGVAGTHFLATPAMLFEIASRLAETGNELAGVEAMVDRQAALWKGDPKMAAFLRPATLFGEKFGDYYGQRELPLPKIGKLNRAALEEKIATSPANAQSVYHRQDATDEEKAQLKQWRKQLRDAD